jgi:hypothetical protein
VLKKYKDMKKINIKIIVFFLLSSFLFIACKKEERGVASEDVITTKDYVYNTATKLLSPENDINIQISSKMGVKSIYSYLIRSNKPDSLIDIYYSELVGDVNEFNLVIPTLNITTADLSQVRGVKLMIKRLDNSAQETFVKIDPIIPATPKLTGFEETILVDNNIAEIIGKVSSENGINKIEILDDADVVFTAVHTIENLNGIKNYDLNYEYSFRAGANNLRVIVTDNSNYTAQVNIGIHASIPSGPFKVFKDVVINSHGSQEKNALIAQTGTLLSSCNLPVRGVESDIMFYTTTAGVGSIYAAGNAGNIIKNYKCDGVDWALQPGESLKATKLRVLDPTKTNDRRIYDAYEANSISDLKTDGLFTGVSLPTSNTSKFVDKGIASTEFDVDTRNLIWLYIPGSPDKNCLLKIKSVVIDGGNSSITFDIYVEN